MFDPRKSERVNDGESSNYDNNLPCSRIVSIDENDMNVNNVERVLGEWALEFNKRVA